MTSPLSKTLNTFLNPSAISPDSYYTATGGKDPEMDALGHGVALGVGYAGVAALLAAAFRDSRVRKAKKMREMVLSGVNVQQPVLSPDPSLRDTQEEEDEANIGMQILPKTAADEAANTLNSAGSSIKDYWNAMRSGASEYAPAISFGGAGLGAVLGYTLTQKLLTDKDIAKNKEQVADLKNRIDKLMYDEFLRTRGVEMPPAMKEAAYNRALALLDEGMAKEAEMDAATMSKLMEQEASPANERGTVNTASSMATSLYLLYALAAGALSFRLAKNMTDKADPARNRLKAMELMTKRRMLYSRPPEFISGTDLDEELRKAKENSSVQQPVTDKPAVQRRLAVGVPPQLSAKKPEAPAQASTPVDATDPIAALLNA